MSVMTFELALIIIIVRVVCLFFSGEMKLVHSQVIGDLAERRGT